MPSIDEKFECSPFESLPKVQKGFNVTFLIIIKIKYKVISMQSAQILLDVYIQYIIKFNIFNTHKLASIKSEIITSFGIHVSP